MTILALFIFKHLPLPKLGSQLLDHMKFSIETSQIMIFFNLFTYRLRRKKEIHILSVVAQSALAKCPCLGRYS